MVHVPTDSSGARAFPHTQPSGGRPCLTVTTCRRPDPEKPSASPPAFASTSLLTKKLGSNPSRHSADRARRPPTLGGGRCGGRMTRLADANRGTGDRLPVGHASMTAGHRPATVEPQLVTLDVSRGTSAVHLGWGIGDSGRCRWRLVSAQPTRSSSPPRSLHTAGTDL